MNSAISAVVQIAALIVGVAILAVLVSRQSNTSGVIKSAGDAFTGALNAAVSPIVGGYQNTFGFQPAY